MSHFVFCLARDPVQARTVVDALDAIGITSDRISVLAATQEDTGKLAQGLHAHSAHGSFTGGNIGGSIGWLAGLGSLAIPGIGLFIAAGPILGFLTGIAVGRAVGNLNGAMIEEMGIPDASLPRYKDGLNAGQVVISAKTTTDDVESVLATLRQTGAQEIGSRPLI